MAFQQEKPIQQYRLVVQYPPSPTSTGGGYVKDQEGVVNFGDSTLLTLQAKDVIEVERTYNAPKGKFGASFTIVKWTPVEKPQQQPYTRARTDPHDQLQIFMTALMKEWMTAYSATLMVSTAERSKMAPVDATAVLQAMESLTTAYRRYHGDRIQSGADTQEPPDQREPMHDEIPEWAR